MQTPITGLSHSNILIALVAVRDGPYQEIVPSGRWFLSGLGTAHEAREGWPKISHWDCMPLRESEAVGLPRQCTSSDKGKMDFASQKY